jgi:phage tail-like protein
MSRYGIDYYGISYYGADVINTYSSAPFVATSNGYGSILLTWVDPVGDWSNIKLVRNSYGFPVNPYDGILLLNAARNEDPTLYLDNDGISKQKYYYYSLFVFETNKFKWVRAGDVIGLSVEDYGHTTRLYDYLPDVYKLSSVYTVDTTSNNQDLKSFLRLFGFQLDYTQTVIRLLTNRYDTETVNGRLLPLILKQFGFNYEAEIGYQQARVLAKSAIQLYQEKGSAQGLREFIKAFSGYALPNPDGTAPVSPVNGITVGHNIMLDYNDSSFEESAGHWVSEETTTGIDQLAIKKIVSYQLISNTARFYIGAHNYDIGNQITISGVKDPIFNNASPVTLTGSNQSAGWIEISLSGGDVINTPGYNVNTNSSGVIAPVPLPWQEPSAPTNFPNKSNGIISIYNETGSTGTITAYCGLTAPVTEGIPITAGLTYSFSIYASKGSYTAKNVTAKIKWFDRLGVYISTSSGSAVSDNTIAFSNSIRPFVSAAAPATAYYACPGVSIASVPNGNHHYFDCAQFEQSASVTEFDEARQLHITPRATRINELLNPHFASPITPWSVTGATSTTDVLSMEPGVETYQIINKSLTSNVATITTNINHPFQIGEQIVVSGVGSPFNGSYTITTRSQTTFSYAKVNSDIPSAVATGLVFHAGNALKLTATGTAVKVKSYTTYADYMPIYYPNSSYTFSVYAKAGTGTEAVTASISWYTSSNVLISKESGSLTTITTDWTRAYITGTAPSTAASAHVELAWTTTVGKVLELDSSLFEKSPFVLPFFDGENGNDIGDLFWEGGVANGARSHLYKNRIALENRLIASIKEYVPMGTTYSLFLAQPKT